MLDQHVWLLPIMSIAMQDTLHGADRPMRGEVHIGARPGLHVRSPMFACAGPHHTLTSVCSSAMEGCSEPDLVLSSCAHSKNTGPLTGRCKDEGITGASGPLQVQQTCRRVRRRGAARACR